MSLHSTGKTVMKKFAGKFGRWALLQRKIRMHVFALVKLLAGKE